MPRSQQAIAEDVAKRLPAPFDDVYFEWDVSDQYIKLVYDGLAERLIECGAIEPHMAEKIGKGEPKPRVDSRGHYFVRTLRIDGETMTRPITIERYIEDQRFAETLPGAPRGLRFKRLDWLDAHPGRVHVKTEGPVEHGSGYIRHSKLIAGTAANLVAAGYREEIFRKKSMLKPGPGREYIADVGSASGYGHLSRLMRGYFQIYISTVKELGAQTSPPTSSRARPSPLRLVVDNTA